MNLDNCFISLCAISIDENAPRRGVGGIYQIRNIINQKRYIGSAIDFRPRWSIHLSTLRSRTSHSRYLQSAWVKYGEDAFVFEIVEIVEGKDNILQREQFYLDTFEPEYNMSKHVEGRRGPWSEESKEKMRKPKSEETKRRMSIGAKRSYELNPELRQSRADNFKAYKDAHPEHGKGSNNGMYGVSLDRLAMISPEAERRRVEKIKQMHKDGLMKHPTKSVEQILPNGEVKRWPSLIEAARAVGRTPSSISNACRGRLELCAGFRWRYADA